MSWKISKEELRSIEDAVGHDAEAFISADKRGLCINVICGVIPRQAVHQRIFSFTEMIHIRKQEALSAFAFEMAASFERFFDDQ